MELSLTEQVELMCCLGSLLDQTLLFCWWVGKLFDSWFDNNGFDADREFRMRPKVFLFAANDEEAVGVPAALLEEPEGPATTTDVPATEAKLLS